MSEPDDRSEGDESSPAEPTSLDPDAVLSGDGGSALGGLGGLGDLGGLLESAQKMMAEAQAAAAEVVEGSAGGGLVTVAVDGHFEFHGVSIDPSAVDADDMSVLEDLVLAALRDAGAEIQE